MKGGREQSLNILEAEQKNCICINNITRTMNLNSSSSQYIDQKLINRTVHGCKYSVA